VSEKFEVSTEPSNTNPKRVIDEWDVRRRPLWNLGMLSDRILGIKRKMRTFGDAKWDESVVFAKGDA
jgi:hypothetical protein